MMDILWPLLIILALISLHAVFVAADFGLIKLHFTRFDPALLERARSRRAVVRMMDAVSHHARVIRFGSMACTLGVGVLLGYLVEHLSGLVRPEEVGTGIRLLVWTGSFLVAFAIHTVLGEQVPRALGIRYPVQALGGASWFIRLFSFLIAPLSRVLERSAAAVLKVLRAEPGEETSLLDVEVQIRSLLSDGAEVSPITERILSNALQLGKLVIQDVLIPRNRIQYFDVFDGVDTNIEIARKSGHTRFPLCEGDLDRCIGLVHIKDLFRQRGDLHGLDLREFRRDILRFSVDDSLDFVLEKLLQQKMHMALAVDDFGGAAGVITLEDILEELVGEIHDEFDREETQIQTLQDGGYLVDGLAPIHDVAEAVGVELSDEDVSTFGGLITSELGRMPKHQETFVLGPLEVTVTGVSEKRVLNARVKPVVPPSDEAG